MFSEQARGRSSGLLARNDVIFPSWFAVCFRSRRRWAWLLEGICVSIDTERTGLVPALDGEMHIFYLVHIPSRVLNVPFNNDPGIVNYLTGLTNTPGCHLPSVIPRLSPMKDLLSPFHAQEMLPKRIDMALYMIGNNCRNGQHQDMITQSLELRTT